MHSILYLRCGLLLLSVHLVAIVAGKFTTPVVVGTWAFVNATTAAWNSLSARSLTAVEAVIEGCSTCESEQCDGTVGYGGSPDENGETALDAMIMDGVTMDAGAVGNLRNVKDAIRVAHAVMKYTSHTMLVGSLGKNVSPDPSKSCGPYEPVSENKIKYKSNQWDDPSVGKGQKPKSAEMVKMERHSKTEFKESVKHNDARHNHDTIGLVAIDKDGHIAAGTSTNGMKWKVPGRVGDSPIIGSGAYCDNEVGGAAATGDGDVLMRFLPSFHAVELLRNGANPAAAAKTALARMTKFYPSFEGGVVVLAISGEYGAACHNIDGGFPFTVMSKEFNTTQTITIQCT